MKAKHAQQIRTGLNAARFDTLGFEDGDVSLVAYSTLKTRLERRAYDRGFQLFLVGWMKTMVDAAFEAATEAFGPPPAYILAEKDQLDASFRQAMER